MKILHIDSSITGDKSISKQLSQAIVAQLKATAQNAEVSYHDLDKNPIPHLGNATLAGEDQASVAIGKEMLKSFKEADVIVIGAPMYNFSVPSQLKAWIDRVAVAGETFKYTENGPVGLSGGKHVFIASVRGGYYSEESGLAALDHQESYLKTVFGFLGIADVTFVRAEGVNISPENAATAIAAAKQEIATLSLSEAA